MPFIVFEGIDGAGKSTLIQEIETRLRADGDTPLCLREPGSTSFGERMRSLLLDPGTESLDIWAEVCLFTAARVQLIKAEIRPALDAGRTVLLDRYFYSTLAYQAYGAGADLEATWALQRAATRELFPARVFWLDLPLDVARSRRGEDRDRIEERGDPYLDRVAHGFRALAEADPQRFHRLDARESPTDLAQQALAAWPSSD